RELPRPNRWPGQATGTRPVTRLGPRELTPHECGTARGAVDHAERTAARSSLPSRCLRTSRGIIRPCNNRARRDKLVDNRLVASARAPEHRTGIAAVTA